MIQTHRIQDKFCSNSGNNITWTERRKRRPMSQVNFIHEQKERKLQIFGDIQWIIIQETQTLSEQSEHFAS